MFFLKKKLNIYLLLGWLSLIIINILTSYYIFNFSYSNNLRFIKTDLYLRLNTLANFIIHENDMNYHLMNTINKALIESGDPLKNFDEVIESIRSENEKNPINLKAFFIIDKNLNILKTDKVASYFVNKGFPPYVKEAIKSCINKNKFCFTPNYELNGKYYIITLLPIENDLYLGQIHVSPIYLSKTIKHTKHITIGVINEYGTYNSRVPFLPSNMHITSPIYSFIKQNPNKNFYFIKYVSPFDHKKKLALVKPLTLEKNKKIYIYSFR